MFENTRIQMNTSGSGTSNRDWWPNQLNLDILHQHSPRANPMGTAFCYAKAFEKLDFEALKNDRITSYNVCYTKLLRKRCAATTALRSLQSLSVESG